MWGEKIDTVQDIPVIMAKRQFELALMDSHINGLIFRPSGFFTDILDVFKMAQAGRVHLFGHGENAITPIEVSDLAHYVVDEMSQQTNVALPKISVGMNLPSSVLKCYKNGLKFLIGRVGF
ncbi:MAG: hypothetical protein DRR19_16725 [Candidatus Parabeggiatoa sp. nov. 1]|nr:MAG: hypothetical protein DRR19_16725 [Gammaproteobacteria bacterium]